MGIRIVFGRIVVGACWRSEGEELCLRREKRAVKADLQVQVNLVHAVRGAVLFIGELCVHTARLQDIDVQA